MWKVGDFCRYNGERWLVIELGGGKACIKPADDELDVRSIWVSLGRIVSAD